jgi:acyl-CoA synthetase (NDP forming)
MSSSALQRLLAPRSVALIGGAWADAALAASRAIGFTGELWRIHPTRDSAGTQRYFRSVDELPAAPDAAFIAAPNREVPQLAAALARRGAGGFVCFAAGFSELATEEGRRLTAELLASAGELPFFGPNCYGFVNFFDGAPQARRGAHLPERDHCTRPVVQRPLAPPRLRAHRRQPDAPCSRGSDRAPMRR